MTEEQYHFIGIGGIGMSGLARMLLEKGISVSGSDLHENLHTQELAKRRARIFLGHAKDQVPHGVRVVVNSDILEDNPELIAAKEKNCPILHRSDLLCTLMKGYEVLAVTGTHGKTSTSALLVHLFLSGGYDPGFAIGGIMHERQINASFGKGRYFIAEADESDATFLKYPYDATICTNIDTDHLAYFGQWKNLVEAFRRYLQREQNPQLCFYCQECPTLKSLGIKGTSYGFEKGSEVLLKNFTQVDFSIMYDLEFDAKTYKEIKVALTGRHNALNSAAVFALATRLGVAEEVIRKAFLSFKGIQRRLEKKGQKNQIAVFDDYAHHPTEIQATLEALRQAVGQKRVIAVFQPHRYSRMRFLLHEFSSCFNSADVVVLTDLYTAKEQPIAEVSSEIIFYEIKRHYANSYFLSRDTLSKELACMVQANDVVITLGAGDITKVGKELLDIL